MNFFTQEWMLVILLCVLLFGANKLPELGKAFGNTIKEFKKSMKEIDSEK
ncbi:MAG: twin-arginine translocase TatA/TatE family subunit [Elusimicrobia bacterium]|nr:twin-arginine translocase TatA/TatE family subunit [Elusimicrobiota bacterium]